MGRPRRVIKNSIWPGQAIQHSLLLKCYILRYKQYQQHKSEYTIGDRTFHFQLCSYGIVASF